MNLRKACDEPTMEAILNYINTVLPGIGVIVMFYDHESEMMRPTSNLEPALAAELAKQCAEHMGNTAASSNTPLNLQ